VTVYVLWYALVLMAIVGVFWKAQCLVLLPLVETARDCHAGSLFTVQSAAGRGPALAALEELWAGKRQSPSTLLWFIRHKSYVPISEIRRRFFCRYG
jgi:hypothetical protein